MVVINVKLLPFGCPLNSLRKCEVPLAPFSRFRLHWIDSHHITLIHALHSYVCIHTIDLTELFSTKYINFMNAFTLLSSSPPSPSSSSSQPHLSGYNECRTKFLSLLCYWMLCKNFIIIQEFHLNCFAKWNWAIIF